MSCGKVEAVEGGHDELCGTSCQGDKELKEMLLRKYGGYLSNLRQEFLKKRKKGKLPKDARKALMDWWNVHYRWPYPTVIQIHIIQSILVHVIFYIRKRTSISYILLCN